MDEQKLIGRGLRKMFGEAARTYELVNHVLTFGLDTVWRRKAARIAAQGGGTKWLDVCSGTGEMAACLRQFAEGRASVVSVDFCPEMVDQWKKKSRSNGVMFSLADAWTLPFKDGTFDLVTISFAMRNLNSSRDRFIQFLREFHRVLKPGGRFVSLETSQPSAPLVRKLFHIYVRLGVRPVGGAISGSKAAYVYLSKTIPAFYSANELSEIIRSTGFNDITFNPLSFGIVTVHCAVKPHSRQSLLS